MSITFKEHVALKVNQQKPLLSFKVVYRIEDEEVRSFTQHRCEIFGLPCKTVEDSLVVQTYPVLLQHTYSVWSNLAHIWINDTTKSIQDFHVTVRFNRGVFKQKHTLDSFCEYIRQNKSADLSKAFRKDCTKWLKYTGNNYRSIRRSQIRNSNYEVNNALNTLDVYFLQPVHITGTEFMHTLHNSLDYHGRIFT